MMAICGMRWRTRRTISSSRVSGLPAAGLCALPSFLCHPRTAELRGLVLPGLIFPFAARGSFGRGDGSGEEVVRPGNRSLYKALPLPWPALFFALLALSVSAQQNELRTVHGTVLDKAENPVASAVVYLKNVRTLAVKTYISDHAGEYRFAGLDPNVDYEIHAEDDKLTSNTRTVSSFDSRKEIVISLKLDKPKKG